jgi:hypothetical protein
VKVNDKYINRWNTSYIYLIYGWVENTNKNTIRMLLGIITPAIVVVLLTLLAISIIVSAACYTPAQYEVIDELASQHNISNSTLRTVFESSCIVTELKLNETVTLLSYNNTNISSIANITATSVCQQIVSNYTNWVNDRIKITELMQAMSVIVNSSSRIESIDSLIQKARNQLTAENDKFQDELTKSMSGFLRPADMANLTNTDSQLSSRISMIEYRLNERINVLDYWWLFFVIILGLFIAWKKGLFKQTDKTIELVKALSGGGRAVTRTAQQFNIPSGEEGRDDLMSNVRKSEKIKKRNEENQKRRLKNVEKALRQSENDDD